MGIAAMPAESIHLSALDDTLVALPLPLRAALAAVIPEQSLDAAPEAAPASSPTAACKSA